MQLSDLLHRLFDALPAIEHAPPAEVARHWANFMCERRPPSVLAPGDVVHPWRWFSRG